MAKKHGLDDIISGLGDIMPPPLNGQKGKSSIKTKGGGIRQLDPAKEEKIDGCTVPLGELLEKRSYDKGLIREIEIKSWGTKFDFYGDFAEKGELYFYHFEPKAEYTPFFSFTPQYGQLNQRQLDYYSLWRYNVRKGKYIKKIDFSYVLLFIYEIINLTPKLISPKTGCRMLAEIWKNYRSMFAPIDKYLCEWMADYCMVHNIPCPHGIIDAFLNEVLKKTSFPEFYLNSSSPSSAEGILFINKSAYDYNSSKYVNDDNREIFDKHINTALSKCVGLDKAKNVISVVRDSYVGALCLYTQKRRMNVTYVCITDQLLDEHAATNAVKYAENMVRMELGIRGRHQDVSISKEIKRKMDSYFADSLFTGERAERLKNELSDDKYQPISTGFSTEEANQIEEESRAVLELLEVGNGEVGERDEAVSSNEKSSELTAEAKKSEEIESENTENNEILQDAPKDANTPELDEISREALLMIYEGRTEDFMQYAVQKGTLPEALADEINYFAFLNIDDIILEERDGGYIVSDEYTEVVREWLKITD